ncbi:MAG: SDR family oxidoreductase [Rhizobiales bacterium]|nr:SDR family oxidoreductase [Hyphomicrobiales bacterium]MBO6698828.1 SDR family oxidoreductase [Hyphomicrobiales bacterium]MBO6734919.1 SDR family oxidoreductase [Hyphomicrobiales bacterium]MBO6911275.1 SDR family oxidoreductase [Hyphomicrobiales bacterium]MBO6955721.1 SDR family oxidoreductase [Hyphomicrobiales bacterium]
MENNHSVEGRLAVVTGAVSGLGRAIAERLAAGGATIVAVDLPDRLSDLPDAWQAEGVDLANDTADAQLKALAARLGKVDILVANAGLVPPWRGLDELDLAEWDRVMRVNVWGVAATIGAFADSLEQSGHGSIVAMASINGYKAHPKQVLYTASKHAVIGVVRAAALDLGPRKIRVNGLAPGPIATEALMGRVETRHRAGGPSPAEALAALESESALGCLATELDVANAAYFLASDASAGMTGVILPVEAGLA